MDNLEKDKNTNLSLSLIADYGTSESESDNESFIYNTGSEGSTELSDMVVKNNIINACAHGPLSGQNSNDVDEVTTHMIIDGPEEGVVEYEVTEYRDADDSDDSSSSCDSELDSVKDIEDVDSDDNEASNKTGKLEPPKVQGELGLDDLPPIEDLAISLPSQDTSKIGTIISVVDRLVIVKALPETPAVDLESVLFVDNGAKALGRVFDVFGPVTEPHYCVRFNSQEHVKERGIETGMDVFIAPKSQHTNYVFWTELIKMKGSDASWLNDVEPPPSQVDFSDDEEERRTKAQKKQSKQAAAPADNSNERNQRAPNRNWSAESSGYCRGRGRRPQRGDFPPSPAGVRPPVPPVRPPVFNPHIPPPTAPFMGMRPMSFPRPYAPMRRPRGTSPFYEYTRRPNAGPQPVFGSTFCSNPQWNSYNEPPPPPGT